MSSFKSIENIQKKEGVLVLEEKIDNIIKGFLGKTINRVHRKSDEWTAFFKYRLWRKTELMNIHDTI